MKIFAIIIIALGAALAILGHLSQIIMPEKTAIYFMGHWFDGIWEVALPGYIIITCGVLMLSKRFVEGR